MSADPQEAVVLHLQLPTQVASGEACEFDSVTFDTASTVQELCYLVDARPKERAAAHNHLAEGSNFPNQQHHLKAIVAKFRPLVKNYFDYQAEIGGVDDFAKSCIDWRLAIFVEDKALSLNRALRVANVKYSGVTKAEFLLTQLSVLKASLCLAVNGNLDGFEAVPNYSQIEQPPSDNEPNKPITDESFALKAGDEIVPLETVADFEANSQPYSELDNTNAEESVPQAETTPIEPKAADEIVELSIEPAIDIEATEHLVYGPSKELLFASRAAATAVETQSAEEMEVPVGYGPSTELLLAVGAGIGRLSGNGAAADTETASEYDRPAGGYGAYGELVFAAGSLHAVAADRHETAVAELPLPIEEPILEAEAASEELESDPSCLDGLTNKEIGIMLTFFKRVGIDKFEFYKRPLSQNQRDTMLLLMAERVVSTVPPHRAETQKRYIDAVARRLGALGYEPHNFHQIAEEFGYKNGAVARNLVTGTYGMMVRPFRNILAESGGPAESRLEAAREVANGVTPERRAELKAKLVLNSNEPLPESSPSQPLEAGPAEVEPLPAPKPESKPPTPPAPSERALAPRPERQRDISKELMAAAKMSRHHFEAIVKLLTKPDLMIMESTPVFKQAKELFTNFLKGIKLEQLTPEQVKYIKLLGAATGLVDGQHRTVKQLYGYLSAIADNRKRAQQPLSTGPPQPKLPSELSTTRKKPEEKRMEAPEIVRRLGIGILVALDAHNAQEYKVTPPANPCPIAYTVRHE